MTRKEKDARSIKIWSIVFGLVVVLGGAGLFVHSMLEPKPIRMIKPSFSDYASGVGQSAWMRLRQQLRKEKIHAVGVQPGRDGHDLVLNGFVSESANDERPYTLVIKERLLRVGQLPLAPNTPVHEIDFRNEEQISEIAEKLKSEWKNEQVLILLPTNFSSHIVKKTPLRNLEKSLQKNVITVSLITFVLYMEDLGRVYPKCDGDAVFGSGETAALGCAAQRKSISLFRKKYDRSRYVFAMDRYGEVDYLLYVHVPRVSLESRKKGNFSEKVTGETNGNESGESSSS